MEATFLTQLLSIFAAIAAFDAFAQCLKANYSGHAVVKVPFNRLDALMSDDFFNSTGSSSLTHALSSLPPSKLDVLWTVNENRSDFAVVRVPPEHVQRIKRDTNYHFLTDDLQMWLESGYNSQIYPSETAAFYSNLVPDLRLDQYNSLADIYRYLAEVDKFDNVNVFDIGLTHEGRKIRAVEIRGDPADQRTTWIDGGTHAREWITPATTLYIIEQIISNKVKANFIIVPVVNPDGFDYTWTTDRLWRKNRRLHKSIIGEFMPDQCNGIDLNRNYDVNFGGEGSSDSPCSNLYQGPTALSEPETRAVVNAIWPMRHRIKLYISLHSFNQLWSCPFAFKKSATPHFAEHHDVLQGIKDAVYKVDGVDYRIGPLGTSLYVGSGFALDWAYSRAKIKHSYLAELRDKGYYGFMLPANQIIGTASETWAGIRVALSKVFDKPMPA